MIKKSVCMLVAIIVVALTGCSDPQFSADEAKQFAISLYPDWTVAAVIPALQDSDGDGYISVTVRITKDNQEKVLNLQCAAYSGRGGCKMAMPTYNQ